jgi:hypothetical protein
MLVYVLEYIKITFIYNTVLLLNILLQYNTLFAFTSKIFC